MAREEAVASIIRKAAEVFRLLRLPRRVPKFSPSELDLSNSVRRNRLLTACKGVAEDIRHGYATLVLTEKWPPGYMPDWPPRWRPGIKARPLVVYLDQWCYAHLAQDRAGYPGTPPGSDGCYEPLRQLALDGSVIFPLSQGHYRENWQRENADARWDTAVVAAELSGFHTLQASSLEPWDALHGVTTLVGEDVPIPDPEVLGWGFQHCLSGHEGTAMVLDMQAGHSVGRDEIPQDVRRSVAEVEEDAAYRLELAVLAMGDPHLVAGGMSPLPPIDDPHGARFVEQEAGIRRVIDTQGRSPKVIRNMIELSSFRDSWVNLVRALRVLGLPDSVLDDAINRSLAQGRGVPVVHQILTAMPIQGAFAELRVQMHTKYNWKLTKSDLLDLWNMATVLPFVDYFVTDKKACNLARDAKLDWRDNCRMVRTPRDLTDLLLQAT